jgi:3-phenylpropionate/trans-cinnamate dioxygenase ferredoxin reductase subunit
VFYLEGDRVKAAVAANAARDLRFARRLIEQGKSVRDVDLADPRAVLAKL